jgi:hypothetical protein
MLASFPFNHKYQLSILESIRDGIKSIKPEGEDETKQPGKDFLKLLKKILNWEKTKKFQLLLSCLTVSRCTVYMLSQIFSNKSQDVGKIYDLPPKNRSIVYVNIIGPFLKEVGYGYQTISSRASHWDHF